MAEVKQTYQLFLRGNIQYMLELYIQGIFVFLQSVEVNLYVMIILCALVLRNWNLEGFEKFSLAFMY